VIADAFNPSSTEVRQWALDPDAEEPGEDWDITLAKTRHELDYLELASDPKCPKRRFFLHVLYLIVGDAARYGFKSPTEPVIRGFLDRAATYRHPDIQLWRQRSLALLKNPGSVDYGLWCAGGYANAAT
jgi:hypothetical protein